MPSITSSTTPIAAVAVAALILAACGGDGSDDTPAASTPAGTAAPAACAEQPVNRPISSQLLPLVISSDMAVGENRFVVGLIDQESGQPVTNAALHLRFVCFDTPDGTDRFRTDAEAITITKTYTHTHEDGMVETHDAGDTGAYVAYVDLDSPGYWGVEVSGTAGQAGDVEPTLLTFAVNEHSFGLAVGDPAPASKQQTLANASDIREIDTSETPIPEQHQMTIAEALSSGKPTVIAFATPAFCQSQICGPTKGIFDDLYARYKDQANFIHIEPYDINRMRAGECQSLSACLVPVVNEWRLQTEPWVFIVGADGNIAAKFDGIASYEEMEAALQKVLQA